MAIVIGYGSSGVNLVESGCSNNGSKVTYSGGDNGCAIGITGNGAKEFIYC